MFSYFYLHGMVGIISKKVYTQEVLFTEYLIELAFTLLFLLYYVLMGERGLGIFSLWAGFYQSAETVLRLALLVAVGYLYEYVLVESIKKIDIYSIVLAQSTGLFWYNLRYMVVEGAFDTRMAVGTLLLLGVTLRVSGVISEYNWQKLFETLSQKKKKKKYLASHVEMVEET